MTAGAADWNIRAARHLRDRAWPPTVIIATSDLMAMRALVGARWHDIAMATQTDPSLTMVALPRYDIGARAMQLL